MWGIGGWFLAIWGTIPPFMHVLPWIPSLVERWGGNGGAEAPHCPLQPRRRRGGGDHSPYRASTSQRPAAWNDTGRWCDDIRRWKTESKAGRKPEQQRSPGCSWSVLRDTEPTELSPPPPPHRPHSRIVIFPHELPADTSSSEAHCHLEMHRRLYARAHDLIQPTRPDLVQARHFIKPDAGPLTQQHKQACRSFPNTRGALAPPAAPHPGSYAALSGS